MKKQLTSRDKQAMETKRKLIQSAHRVFLHNGFDKTTVSQIIKDAGVGYGTAYVYFKNKHDIFVTIMGELMEQFFDVAKQEFRPETAEEAHSLIEKQVRDYMNLAINQRPMLRVVKNAIGSSEQIGEEWENIRHEFIQGITADITYSQDKNLADASFDPIITAKSWYYMNEMYMWQFVESESFELDPIVDQLAMFYTKALYRHDGDG
ncbi:TetR/AcrR family transcriptional regulator [Lentibacillus halophilus]|uniref:TetR/AcrR family transcriptional regulator n=1 Tax=Lentibacillus halophilus TaxID=295065 RepID=A0ABP3J342_9BACI